MWFTVVYLIYRQVKPFTSIDLGPFYLAAMECNRHWKTKAPFEKASNSSQYTHRLGCMCLQSIESAFENAAHPNVIKLSWGKCQMHRTRVVKILLGYTKIRLGTKGDSVQAGVLFPLNVEPYNRSATWKLVNW